MTPLLLLLLALLATVVDGAVVSSRAAVAADTLIPICCLPARQDCPVFKEAYASMRPF
jgi:hypothetical protein